ncbi:mitochondrial import inner membrane translocase subunit Tim29 [Aethina tumida]|uniref:mitochondrial import inner membrane translocase subunit Tim29 n=1 Tax=Aethina tumida TaxID=116153 RepID=UPI002149703F|nr:mitochondrial import inner membrane translocase subunit Tim29 [Aethina tumida]
MFKVHKSALHTLTKTSEQLKSIVEKGERKIKGTFLEKWVKYWKLLYKDYTEVALSVKQDLRERPIKSAFTIAGLSAVGLMICKNPDMQSFRAKYLECQNNLSVVSPSLVNPVSVDYLKYIEKCYNGGLIRHTSLGLFSVVWRDNYSDECDIYENNCSYLQLPYSKFPSSIIDIGFLNIWWITSRKMIDYDINY